LRDGIKKKTFQKKKKSTSTSSFNTPTSRPKNINEIAHQEEVVKALNRSLETANVRVVFCWKQEERKKRGRCIETGVTLAHSTSTSPKKNIFSSRTSSSTAPRARARPRPPWRSRGSFMGRTRYYCSLPSSFFYLEREREGKKERNFPFSHPLKKKKIPNTSGRNSSRPASSSSTPPTSAALASSAPRLRPSPRAPSAPEEAARAPPPGTPVRRTNFSSWTRPTR